MNAGISKAMVPHTQGYRVSTFSWLAMSANMMDFHGCIGIKDSILFAQYAPQSSQLRIMFFFRFSHLTNCHRF
jgi:hypothetical protein